STSSIQVNATPPKGGTGCFLVDCLEDGEHWQVHGNHHAADDRSDDCDHEWLDERSELLRCRLHLVVIEVGDLAQHRFKGAGILTDRHHLHDHRWKHRDVPERV